MARFHFAQASDPDLVADSVLSAAPRRDHTWVVPDVATTGELVEEATLQLPAGVMHELRLQTAIDVSQVSRLILRGVFSNNSLIETALLRKGKEVGQARRVVPREDPEVQTIEIDLLPFRMAAIPFDGVVLRVGSSPLDAVLLTLDFLERPLAAWLPTLESGGKLVSADNQAMRAVGILESQPLAATVEVRQPGERLRFAAFEPKVFWCGKTTKHLVLETVEGELLHRMTLVPDPQLPSAWLHADVDLDPWLGKTLDLRFRVEGTPGKVGKDLIALSEPTVSRPGDEQRIVLLVTSDTHRADHLGNLMGPDLLTTPAIDSLSARGVQFTDAWSTTNITQPSHTALLTGLSPRDTRVVANSGYLRADAFTLAEAFYEAGWATYGAVSVRHLGPRGGELGQGFDRIVDPFGDPWDAEVPVEYMRDWITEANGRPVFAWLHVFDAHDPYAPPPAFDRRYYPEDRDPNDPSLPGFEKGRTAPHYGEVRDREFPPAQYRAEISYLDSQLAKLFAIPRVAAGHVAFTSDHGEILHGLGTWFNHSLSVPATLHVPLILAGPDVPHARVDLPVEHRNLARTLLDLAGLGRVDFPGSNLLEFVEADGPQVATRFAMGANGRHAAVTRGSHHLILFLRDYQGFLNTSREAHQVELYDHVNDPRLEHDLSRENEALAGELRAELVDWLGQAMPGGLSSKSFASAESLAELAALGYAHAEEIENDEEWIAQDCTCTHCAHWRALQ